MRILFAYALLVLLSVVPVLAQTTGAIEGQVTDKTGAVIPGAGVAVTGAVSRSVTTNENGAYSITGLAPGSYKVRITTTGFAPFERTIDVSAGRATKMDAPLEVMLETQKVTVEGETQNTVSTDPSANAGALVIKGQDLEMLSDDPDELADDLQALAGPAAGPNGGQIFIDGFSGGRLPPKSSIREVRINQNPFAAEYDRLGFGRIEILTKPGTDKYRGQAMFNFSDDALNSRNPFSPTKPEYMSKQYEFNFGGPLSKKASFFVDAERRDIDDNAVINAVVLNPDLSITNLQESVVTPNNRTSVTPRVDYQISPKNTLVARYNFAQINFDDVGIGDFTLPVRGYNTRLNESTVQLTETAVLNATSINETRLQYVHENSQQLGASTDPALNVLQSFNGGGSPIGIAGDVENRWEVQNMTSLVRGRHNVKFGGRLRVYGIDNTSPNNFNGTFTFGGGDGVLLNPDFTPILGPDGKPVIGQVQSIERYQRTLYFQEHGYTPEQIRALSGGATQFSLAAGNPAVGFTPVDGGLYVQDDWRFKPSLTLSFGLRYELQNYLSNYNDFGPRFGFAWAPGTRQGKTGKTVIRGGFGMFYDRVGSDLILSTLRYNGTNQQQYIINNPDFFPNVPSPSELSGLQPQTVQAFNPNLRAPYLMQIALGVERQLPRSTTVAVNYTGSRGAHMLRSQVLPVVENRPDRDHVRLRVRRHPETKPTDREREQPFQQARVAVLVLRPELRQERHGWFRFFPGPNIQSCRRLWPRHQRRSEPILPGRFSDGSVGRALESVHQCAFRFALQYHDRPRQQPRHHLRRSPQLRDSGRGRRSADSLGTPEPEPSPRRADHPSRLGRRARLFQHQPAAQQDVRLWREQIVGGRARRYGWAGRSQRLWRTRRAAWRRWWRHAGRRDGRRRHDQPSLQSDARRLGTQPLQPREPGCADREPDVAEFR